MATPIIERILGNVVMITETGCWIWMGWLRNGYGRLQVKSKGHPTKQLNAHVVSYEHFKGPVPAGLELDHLCRVRCCANPHHLEAVTHIVNVRRGRAGAHLRSRTHCPKGHAYDAGNTSIKPTGARRCKACQKSLDERKRRAHGIFVRATHCHKGHAFTEDNTKIYSGATRRQRICITCYKERITRQTQRRQVLRESAI